MASKRAKAALASGFGLVAPTATYLTAPWEETKTAACAPSIATTDGCTIFRPIHGSKNDTQKTRNQVDQHNARGIGACGWTAK